MTESEEYKANCIRDWKLMKELVKQGFKGGIDTLKAELARIRYQEEPVRWVGPDYYPTCWACELDNLYSDGDHCDKCPVWLDGQHCTDGYPYNGISLASRITVEHCNNMIEYIEDNWNV